jgi:hypothetical protein
MYFRVFLCGWRVEKSGIKIDGDLCLKWTMLAKKRRIFNG